MSTIDDFRELIRRVRSGDAAAAKILVDQYSSQILRTIRVQMNNPRLRRTVDSHDICQSVLGDFFARVALGQYNLKEPDDLVRLLVTMASNRVTHHARRSNALKRGKEYHQESSDGVLVSLQSKDSPPSDQLIRKEILEQIVNNLPPELVAIHRARIVEGKSWAEIAAELGESVAAVSKRYHRALNEQFARLNMTTFEVDPIDAGD
ncbi:RNA polymerase sigma factor [Tuwongella immobilis]|uniref:RNA polymerase sigma-70 ECF-like HTH domain-containing protein n=1 Tax=Tuwongella immobilis TaxID=692036 RepID=A0A6C2YVZ2_9BACT|nr:sigma-70 family RNA polymerase sigma factor [Tuwongella immobilis]VIP05551.1 rna polymerase sigma-70 ecf-like protein : DNA-directed RNA polymerase specialized sigma subunit, sigma24 OS=Singulisphaera acidiphila (strain ATCC BAA-1392 / DSM 18658 / VKM B-2454 / MOB10) GN=Sinac_5214 PE=4 SV=1: Sigma70_ECF [Tuwongella immobilis]VTS08458.1 rna polymerase sigma-70 ecf-like protein : DNA-directed RNA polymerase specialized sigma subunit, sigma24 OS=Singulisphaera acidiphila (strain ATCC BAA-1392 / D